MKAKYYLIIILLMTASAIVSWYATYTHFRNKQVPIITLTKSSNPNYLFDYTTTNCQPNLMNGSCSNMLKSNYQFVMDEETAYWKNQANNLINACKNAIGSMPTYTPPSIQSTECYRQIGTGELICNTYGR